jgi:hypothetical protein
MRACRAARGRTRVEGLVLEEGMAAVGKELGIMLGLAGKCGVASVVDVVWLKDAAVVVRGLSARDDGCVGDCNDEGDEEEKSGEHWMGRGTGQRLGLYSSGTSRLFVHGKSLRLFRKGYSAVRR